VFSDELKIAVTLRNDKKQEVVPGARVKSCALELLPHGFSGRVTLWSDVLDDDKLAAWFLEPELMEIELSVAPVHGDKKDIAAARIELHGLVSDRSVSESVVAVESGKERIEREYTIAFVDPAALLWRQHQPLELRADAKLKQILEAHLAGHVKLDCSLADADKTRPILCLPSSDGDASFYDFVVWYADRAGAAWQYDYWAKRYRLAAHRQAHAAKQSLQLHEVASLRVSVPALARRSARVLNGHSDAAQTLPVALAHTVAGIARDRLMRASSGADVDAVKEHEQARLQVTHPEVEVELTRFPLVPLMPGAEASLRKDQFSAELHPVGKTFRVVALSLAAEAADTRRDHRGGEAARVYKTQLRLLWESNADARARLPRYEVPLWPLHVEGTIVSEIGAAHDRTYQPSDDKQTSLSHYVVHVPLWNQKIKVPFGPQFLPGHFFAPAFKGSRVLLALYFEHAEIAQFLDWGPDVRLPNESQGNHLLFGKNAKSQTSLKHAYIDDKPVLSLTNVREADHERLQLEPGTLVLEVKEDTSAAAGGETHDLTGQVAASHAKLEGGAQQALGKIKASSQKGQGLLDGKLSGARASLSSALEGLDGEVSGKVAAGKAELQGQVAAVEGRVAELRARVDAGKAELEAKRGGG
jgi:hypothetical protein